VEALELASTEQDRVDEYHAAVEAHGGDDTNVHMPKANIMMLGKGVWWWCCFCCVGLGCGTLVFWVLLGCVLLGCGVLFWGLTFLLFFVSTFVVLLYTGRTPLQHVVHHLKMVKSVRLNEALLVMPLSIVQMLFRFVYQMMESGLQVELGAKVLFFLLKTHQDTLVSNHTMRDQLKQLRDKTRSRIAEHRDRMGLNRYVVDWCWCCWLVL
jgi:hypothetical protein